MAVEQRGTKIHRDYLGLVTVTAAWVVDTLEETLTVGDPAVLGLPEFDRDFTQQEGGPGRFKGTITYQGVPDDADLSDKYDWEFLPAYRDKPIEAHHNLLDILDRFDGQEDPEDGRVTFALRLSDKNRQRRLPGRRDRSPGSEEKNPYYGLTSYAAVGGVYRRSRLLREIPENVLANIGRILKQLPDDLPTPENHDWRIMPPAIRKRGNVLSVDYEAMLSDYGGWPEGLDDIAEDFGD